jgi:hypothetical protein
MVGVDNALNTKKEDDEDDGEEEELREDGREKAGGFIHPSTSGHLPSSDMKRMLMEAVANDFMGERS